VVSAPALTLLQLKFVAARIAAKSAADCGQADSRQPPAFAQAEEQLAPGATGPVHLGCGGGGGGLGDTMQGQKRFTLEPGTKAQRGDPVALDIQ